MRRLADCVELALLNPLPGLDHPSADGALRAALTRALELPEGDLVQLVELLAGSAADFLDRWFETDAIKVPLVIDEFYRGGREPVDAGLGLPDALPHDRGDRDRPADLGQVRGGMGGITAALASCAQAAGATVGPPPRSPGSWSRAGGSPA